MTFACSVQMRLDPEMLALESQASSFSQSWTFDALASGDYTFNGSKIEFSGGVCRLTGNDQVDDDDSASGFGGGTLTGVAWDATREMVRLGNGGGCDGGTGSCAPTVAPTLYELHSSWTPQWANLQGYWKFNNDLLDSSGKGNHGAANVAAQYSTDNKVGTAAASFTADNVISEGVRVNGAPGLNNGSTFTIMFWGKLTASSDWWCRLLKKGTEANGDSSWMVTRSAGNSGILLRTDTSALYNDNNYSSIGVFDGTYHHVAFTVNNGTVKIFIDGKLDVTETYAVGTGLGNNEQLYIGYKDVGAECDGKLDELAIWDTVLTHSEVAQIYHRQAIKYSGVVTSRVLDALANGMSWTTLSWLPTLPFLKPLPSAGQSESSSAYSSLAGSTGTTEDPDDTDDDLMEAIQGLWHLDETAATGGADNDFSDDSGNSRHGEAAGTMSYGNAGIFDKAPVFNGSDAYISVADMPAISAPYTISVWAQPTATTAVSTMIGTRNGSNPSNFDMKLLNGNQLHADIGTGSGWITTAADATLNYKTGHWYHIVYVVTASNYSIYIDGSYAAGAAIASGAKLTNGTDTVLHIGSYGQPGEYFNGALDEVAIWSRALHGNEIQQLYRRGSNRIKYQVRVCTAADCSDDASGANWKGPDGTPYTAFSELNNNTVALDGSGDVRTTAPSMLFSDFTIPVGTSRYFQYRTILESQDAGTGCDYGSGTVPCSPELKSVTVDPIHYDATSPTVVTKNGVSYLTLSNFAETLGTSCAGGIGYNLGVGADSATATWYWWDGTAWEVADGTVAESNSASDVSARAANFSSIAGAGTVYVKAFLKSSGNQACELDRVTLSGWK